MLEKKAIFAIDNITVRAGGVLKSKGGRRVVLEGRHCAADDGERVKGFGRNTFLLFSAENEFVPVSQYTITVPAVNVELDDSASHRIRVKCDEKMAQQLLGKDLGGCILKLAFWYRCPDVTNLHCDGQYLYGCFESDYDYKIVKKPYFNNVTLCFYNLPSPTACHIDAEGVLHAPHHGSQLRYCVLGKGLVLAGDRKLVIEGIEFVGFQQAVTLSYRNAANKTISNCTFGHCINGVYCDNGLVNFNVNTTVENCRFENMVGSRCIAFYGCDNVTITRNRCHSTGLINKAYEVIGVAGNGFNVSHNEIKDFSYIGIRVGNTREWGALKIAGVIENNLIDNLANYGREEKCLNDGGGIYVFTHQDSTVVRGNVIRNIGYEGSAMRGIFMDDGAYNTHIIGNLVYNIHEGMCIESRLVSQYDHHNGNNLFLANVCVGRNKVYGHTGQLMPVTRYEHNFVCGSEEIDPQNVASKGNEPFEAEIVNGKVKLRGKTYKRIKNSLNKMQGKELCR